MNRWFRFYDGALDNAKVQRLSCELFRAWINCLCIANRNQGYLPPLGDLAFALRVDEGTAADMVGRLQSARLIDQDDRGYFPHDWKKLQFQSDDSSERVRRHRDKGGDGNGDVTVDVTPPETEADTEQNRKKRERVHSPARDRSEFQSWYAEYPIHKAPEAAERAYWKARTKVGADVLLAAARRFRATTAGTEKRFVAHPATWLNQGRWADQDDSAATVENATQADSDWRMRCRSLFAPPKDSKPYWASSWGEKPGHPHCQVPPHILAEFNLGQSEAA